MKYVYSHVAKSGQPLCCIWENQYVAHKVSGQCWLVAGRWVRDGEEHRMGHAEWAHPSLLSSSLGTAMKDGPWTCCVHLTPLFAKIDDSQRQYFQPVWMSALETRISALPLCRQARLICGPSAGAQIYVFFFSVKLCEKCVLPLSQCLCPCLRSVSFPFCSPQVPGAPPNPIILHVSTGGPRPQAPQTWPGGILPCARTPGAR